MHDDLGVTDISTASSIEAWGVSPEGQMESLSDVHEVRRRTPLSDRTESAGPRSGPLTTSALTSDVPRWEIEFDWHLTNRCNFDCKYCHPQIKYVLNKKNLSEPDFNLVVRRFNELGHTSLIHMSGGEPFLYPDFVKLCQGLSEHHFISINTNLANNDVDAFSRTVPADRVVKIAAALHVEERERLGIDPSQFVGDVTLLGSRGFPVSALYILFPPLLSRAESDIANMRASGQIDVQAKVFKGIFEGKRYPEAYSDSESELVQALSGSYKLNREYLTQPLTYQGRMCSAGVTSFKITVTGDVRRCASVADGFGNLYDGSFVPSTAPTVCPARRILVLSQCRAYVLPVEGGE